MSILALLLWLFLPLSQCSRQSLAQDEMELMLFDYNRINPQLFSGPIIKYNNGKESFEWTHIEDKDTITAGVNVSKFRFFSLFPVDGYFIGSDRLWDKIFHTDPNYKKPLSE